MTDKLSVVARAIGAQHCRALDLDPDDWDGLEAGDRLMYRDWAKAAIEAHEKALEERGLVIVPREPTDEMVKAAARLLVEATKEYSLEPDVDDVTDALVSRMLRKAADAALDEKP